MHSVDQPVTMISERCRTAVLPRLPQFPRHAMREYRFVSGRQLLRRQTVIGSVRQQAGRKVHGHGGGEAGGPHGVQVHLLHCLHGKNDPRVQCLVQPPEGHSACAAMKGNTFYADLLGRLKQVQLHSGWAQGHQLTAIPSSRCHLPSAAVSVYAASNSEVCRELCCTPADRPSW